MSSKPRLLLLSNSTMSGSAYMEWSKGLITQFLTTKVEQILFIPFAAVSIDWDKYESNVSMALKEYTITSIHRHKTEDYLQIINKSEAILIGGGNTFHLLYKLQELNVLEAIRNRVIKDGIPYVGWSAGANVSSPDIATTNDMPIIWPKTDRALDLIAYNINPHYNQWRPEGHGGETRDDRLNECLLIKKRPIVAISEGIAIAVEDDKHTIIAPDLQLNPDNRCVKIWSFNSKSNKTEVIDVSFDREISSIISQLIQ